MGTSVDIVAFADTGEPLDVWAHRLVAISTAAEPSGDVVVHLTRTPAGSHRFLWIGISDDRGINAGLYEEAARIASEYSENPVIAAWYSDSAGMAGYKVFEQGRCSSSNDTELSPEIDIVNLFCRPFGEAYPGSEIGCPDDVFDLCYGENATEESYVIGSSGTPLESPQSWLPPPPEPQGWRIPHEFRWGRKPRSFLKGLAVVFGLLSTGLILFTVGWFLYETVLK